MDVRAGDLANLFANELEPQTENHYFLDTCNKMKNEALLAALDECLDSHLQTTGVTSRARLRGALVQALTEQGSIGSSNAQQVIYQLPILPLPTRLRGEKGAGSFPSFLMSHLSARPPFPS